MHIVLNKNVSKILFLFFRFLIGIKLKLGFDFKALLYKCSAKYTQLIFIAYASALCFCANYQ